MFTELTVSNFRCFEDLRLRDLARVNLIAGPNNVGKTALLEAIFLHCGPLNPGLTLSISVFRGIERIQAKPEPLWGSLFYRFDTQRLIEISSRTEEGRHHVSRLRLGYQPAVRVPLPGNSDGSSSGPVSPNQRKGEAWPATVAPSDQVLELTYEEETGPEHTAQAVIEAEGIRFEPPPLPPTFLAIFLAARSRVKAEEDAERYGALDLVGQQEAILDTLRGLEPRLQRLAVVVTGGVPTLHGDVGLGRLLPVPLLGDGMGRLLSLSLAIANAPNGLILVDEIENGLYHNAMVNVWQAVAEIAERFNVQVFATTHSEECIRSAHIAFTNRDSYDLRMHRLDPVRGAIRATTYDQEMLEAAFREGLEVR
jgi:hypothetical protein